MAAEISDYYRQGFEGARLEATAWGRLEYLRTWDLLMRHLPEPGARVLDVGGGTGVYAGELALAGYQVKVIDLLAEHVAAAARLPGVDAAVGDARDLGLPDGSVDAVLLLGPLYHLPERADRLRAWREAARVVRPGGTVVAAVISRFASLFDGFVKGYAADPEYLPMVESTLDTGAHVPPPGRSWFTTAYFHHPDEIAAEVQDAGLALRSVSLIEGPLWMMGPELARVMTDPEPLLRRLRQIEHEPSLLGASSHLFVAAQA